MPELLVIASVPDALPPEADEILTGKVQDAPGLSGTPTAQVLPEPVVKFPVSLTSTIVRSALPVFEMVSGNGEEAEEAVSGRVTGAAVEVIFLTAVALLKGSAVLVLSIK